MNKTSAGRYGAVAAFGTLAVGSMIIAFPACAELVLVMGSVIVGIVCAMVVAGDQI
jgi:hypothetical protein